MMAKSEKPESKSGQRQDLKHAQTEQSMNIVKAPVMNVTPPEAVLGSGTPASKRARNK